MNIARHQHRPLFPAASVRTSGRHRDHVLRHRPNHNRIVPECRSERSHLQRSKWVSNPNAKGLMRGMKPINFSMCVVLGMIGAGAQSRVNMPAGANEPIHGASAASSEAKSRAVMIRVDL
jgi:hypothetical protein